jgi:hypothetical protein
MTSSCEMSRSVALIYLGWDVPEPSVPPFFCPLDPMSILKLFKKSPSKKDTPDSSPANGIPVNDEEVPRATGQATDNGDSAYPDYLKEAWTAAHQELPRAHGAEKALNKIGGLVISSHPRLAFSIQG